jgi:hypothetical protein
MFLALHYHKTEGNPIVCNGVLDSSINMIPEWQVKYCSIPDQGVLGPFPPSDRDRTGRQTSGNVRA